MKDRALEYFKAFNNQDTSKLREMYSEHVTLRDWIVDIKGRENVINENKKGFESTESILIGVRNLYHDSGGVIAEIDIYITNKEGEDIHLKVADVIEFDNEKISSIREYLGTS